jgi:hypothetical protein
MVQFDSRGHYTNKERFLAFARNDKQSNGRVMSKKVRDLSELSHDLPDGLSREKAGDEDSSC